MAKTVRFGMSIDEGLLDRFDKMIDENGYMNRSEAIRDLIRDRLISEQWEKGEEEAVGTITLVYNHHTKELSDKLIDHQHDHHKLIISSMHIHLDSHHCLEVVVVKGKPLELKRLSDQLIGAKGVQHGKFVTTSSGKDLT